MYGSLRFGLGIGRELLSIAFAATLSRLLHLHKYIGRKRPKFSEQSQLFGMAFISI